MRYLLLLVLPLLLLVGCRTADSEALQRAHELASLGDTEGARLLAQPMADAGDAEAQYLVGTMLLISENGTTMIDADDFPERWADAMAWIERAADNGHAQAANDLGLFSMLSRRYDDARTHFQRAADLGHVDALTGVATVTYLEHVNAEHEPDWTPDPNVVVRYVTELHRAIDAGSGEAASSLSRFLEGIHTAAGMGDSDAQNYLTVLGNADLL